MSKRDETIKQEDGRERAVLIVVSSKQPTLRHSPTQLLMNRLRNVLFE